MSTSKCVSQSSMPLVHKTLPVPRSKTTIDGPNSGAPSSGNSGQVYKIRFTTEKFRNYADYLERLDFYRQRIFTCRYTGRSHLTYEEALTSEFKSTRLNKIFPEALLEPMVRKLHGLQMETEDAVTTLQVHLNSQCWPGEVAVVPSNVLAKTNVANMTEVEVEIASVDTMHQTVQVMFLTSKLGEELNSVSSQASPTKFEAITGDAAIATVPAASIIRKSSHSLTTEMLKNKILCISTHGNYKDAPWVVNPLILCKLKPPPKLSAAATAAMEAKEPKEKNRKKRRREEGPATSSSPSRVATTSTSPATAAPRSNGADSASSKRRFFQSDAIGHNLDAHKDESVSKRRKMAVGGTDASKGTSKKDKPEGEAPKSKYPMEDLAIERAYVEPPLEEARPARSMSLSPMDVDPATNPTNASTAGNGDLNTESAATASKPKPTIDPKLLRFPPRPASDFFVPQSCMSDLLTLCSYLSAFHETLTLSPFPAEDLVMALNHPEHSSLLGELHHRLLRHLNAHNNNLPKMSAKVWEPNLIYYLKAKLPIFGHVALYAKLKREGYFSLSLAQKLQILVFIAHMVSNSRLIERPASDYPDKKLSIEKQAQEAQMKLKRQYKDQKYNSVSRLGDDFMSAADLKERLALEQEKYAHNLSHLAAIRTHPLGQDRYHNTYWWFGKNAYRACANSGGPAISALEAFVLVEYHDGNVDESSLPPHYLDDYASDEEERQEAIAYLENAQSSTTIIEDDMFDYEDDELEFGSRSRQEEIEYDHNGRPIRKSKLLSQKHDEDEDEDDFDEGRTKRKESRSTCEICQLPTDLHKMLLCDVCDKAHHMYCLQPPLTKIPEGDWFCPVCSGGELPPPPTVMPVAVPTRGAQQRLLEIQMAALKREEEERKKREEEAAKEARVAELKAQRAAERAAATAAAAAKAISSTSNQSTTVSGTSSPSLPSKNSLQVDNPSAENPQVKSTPETSTSNDATNATTTTTINGDNTIIPSSSVPSAAVSDNAMAVDYVSTTPVLALAPRSRGNFSQLKPAPRRVKDTANYMQPRVASRWGYYETQEELTQLIAWLDERGIREKELKSNLKKKLPMITALMENRLQQFRKIHTEVDLPTRRSTRHTQFERKQALEPFMAYVNKAGENQR